MIAQSSWTRPSIGSMITSLYPRSLGIYKERFDILPDDHWTLAEILQANGYRTVGITANPNINTVFNFHQGFEDYEDSSVIWPWMMPEQNKKKRDRESGVPSSQVEGDIRQDSWQSGVTWAGTCVCADQRNGSPFTASRKGGVSNAFSKLSREG